MKKQMLLVALAAAFSVSTFAAVPDKAAADTVMKPVNGQTQAALWASKVLTRYHYKAVPLDDAMSEKIFDRYFKSLDAEKLFFTQADVDQYASVRTRLDDAINGENLTVPFNIYNQYQQRFAERIAYARELLKAKFDFNVDESYQYDREKAEWAKSDAEIKELWRKRVKNDWLRLKLAGKDDKGIRETLDKRYENYMSRSRKLNNEDVFQIFMNAYAMSIEPHTNYLGPRASENFDIAMRLSLEGIGCVLQTRDEYTVVREVVPGSPAGLSGKIKVGDRILAVGQDSAGPMTEVLGWRIDDVVALIRGTKDSTVRLDVLPADAGPDGKHATIALVRKKISMEEQSAKKSILEVKDGTAKRRIGVISLPTFYQDFEARRKGDKDFKSATRDVARLLGELKKDKVDNVLIDLRNNGGGSLNEAVELTGLFIDKGPVVQQRNAEGKIEVESDTQAGLAWDGPVGVLINRGSASASEIFATPIRAVSSGSSLKHSKWRPPKGVRWRLTVGASSTSTPLRRDSNASRRPSSSTSSSSHVAASAVGDGTLADVWRSSQSSPRTPAGPSETTRRRRPAAGSACSDQKSAPVSNRTFCSSDSAATRAASSRSATTTSCAARPQVYLVEHGARRAPRPDPLSDGGDEHVFRSIHVQLGRRGGVRGSELDGASGPPDPRGDRRRTARRRGDRRAGSAHGPRRARSARHRHRGLRRPLASDGRRPRSRTAAELTRYAQRRLTPCGSGLLRSRHRRSAAWTRRARASRAGRSARGFRG
jgi:C-terminal peptidase prc